MIPFMPHTHSSNSSFGHITRYASCIHQERQVPAAKHRQSWGIKYENGEIHKTPQTSKRDRICTHTALITDPAKVANVKADISARIRARYRPNATGSSSNSSSSLSIGIFGKTESACSSASVSTRSPSIAYSGGGIHATAGSSTTLASTASSSQLTACGERAKQSMHYKIVGRCKTLFKKHEACAGSGTLGKTKKERRDASCNKWPQPQCPPQALLCSARGVSFRSISSSLTVTSHQNVLGEDTDDSLHIAGGTPIWTSVSPDGWIKQPL